MSNTAKPTFTDIENAAHSGAFGRNSIPEPTESQCAAGNYKVGRFSFNGLPIVIEQPRGSYRTGINNKTGKRWVSRMSAHYGYIGGTKGADGDAVDCFFGFYPESEHAYVINQNIDDRFDEHKTMLAFPDQETATSAYISSFDRDWTGLESIIQLSISQLKWWLKNGNKNKPLNKEDLPQEGLESMNRVYWNKDAMPEGRTLDQLLFDIRKADAGENLLMDAVSISEILEGSDGVLAFDALVTPYAKLERKMEILQGIMERTGKDIKPVSMQISEPFRQNGVANVAVSYELSDGQTITIYLHNPDVTPKKMAPTDEVISWKWMLNKKDITIVVAPERGTDLNVREVARRILKLAEKNSAGFARANAKRAERMQNIQNLKDEIVELEKELKEAQDELEVAKIEAADRESKVDDLQIAVREALSKMGWKGFEEGDAMTINDYRASGEVNGFKVERIDRESGVWETVGAVSIDVNKTADQIAKEIVEIASPAANASTTEELDPTSPEDYAKIRGIANMELRYQDALDSFFQDRILSVWKALGVLGWEGTERSYDSTKHGYTAKFNFKKVGGGDNIVGFWVSVMDGSDIQGEVGDSLTKTPEQLAAEIDSYIPVSDVSESEEITAAKAFLQSIVDGTSNASDLMKLLDEIDASAQALIDAGMGDQYDELIGNAAEKWAELDQQANG